MIWNLEDGKTMAFNSMSCALAEIDDNFINIIENIDQINYDELENEKKTLVDNMLLGRYILDNDFDELKALKYEHFSAKFNDNVLQLTIAPTLSCNFACPYCYENPKKGIMSKNVQDAIIDWVVEEAKKRKDISISWYGGEPLLAKNVIFDMSEKIIKVCKENNTRYGASMVTNGYLLDDATISKLKELKVNSVQVTLDGPANIHNTRRVLKNSNEGTFNVILSNIKKLKENNINIMIRMNVDKTNVDSIDEFLNILAQNNLRDTSVSFGRVTSGTEACVSMIDSCMNTEEYAKENLKYQQKLFENGFNTDIEGNFTGFYPSVKTNYCGADNVGTFVLDPEGYMYKCWCDVGETHRAVGNVLERHNELNEEMYMRNITYIFWSPFDHEECLKCNLLPICMGGCPHNGLKNGSKPECESWKYNLKEVLKMTYLQNNPND